ncbi:MAG: FkbM family methyltransferase [Lachnospiraceae bacterium]|nr:FkbM family methyltransferase [Lachnospiraceae bacterium]
MQNVFIWGTGYYASEFAARVIMALDNLEECRLIGFVDNATEKNFFLGYPVYQAEVLKRYANVVVILAVLDQGYKDQIKKQIYQILPTVCCVEDIYWPLKKLVKRNNFATTDKDIKETIKYWDNNPLTVYNQFIKEEEVFDEVFFDDKIQLPYIWFRTIDGGLTKMFFPNDYNFVHKDGARYVYNLMAEQVDDSPHLYVKDNHRVCEGDSIVDAGVCEGNFSLKYINVASHIYLFENDPEWIKPLYYSFLPVKEKVTFVGKGVSNVSSDKLCRIDDVVKRKVDFLKMDIEGWEIDALKGAEKTLLDNNVKSSICCYHKKDDERLIKNMFESIGYKTTTSSGYMLFVYGDDTWKYGDFRKGIIYANKK